jgi:glycosyltransferase involved in cell wall biosynthesis
VADQPLFSIISIAYQDLDGLRGTIDSVRRQTFGDYEHIVVDGGSTDGTAEWLGREFAGGWVSERDRGRYDAMNKGARMARGEYLWFLHAGDRLGDDRVLERVATVVADRPDWAYGLARVVFPDGRLQGTLGFVPFRAFDFVVVGRPLPHQATVVRRELFHRIGGYDESVPVAADQLFMLMSLDISEPRAIPDFLCDFDATGISAGRPWLVDYIDGLRNRRRTRAPVTAFRWLDDALAFGFAVVRQLARRTRRALSRPAATVVAG